MMAQLGLPVTLNQIRLDHRDEKIAQVFYSVARCLARSHWVELELLE
jgi:hypothetical protein